MGMEEGVVEEGVAVVKEAEGAAVVGKSATAPLMKMKMTMMMTTLTSLTTGSVLRVHLVSMVVTMGVWASQV
jgi:hypothetical protein